MWTCLRPYRPDAPARASPMGWLAPRVTPRPDTPHAPDNIGTPPALSPPDDDGRPRVALSHRSRVQTFMANCPAVRGIVRVGRARRPGSAGDDAARGGGPGDGFAAALDR